MIDSMGLLGMTVAKAVEGSGGCAICYLAGEVGFRYVRTVLYEYVNDVSFRSRFSSSMGFCRQHWDTMLAQPDLLGNGILLESLVSQALGVVTSAREITDSSRSTGKGRRSCKVVSSPASRLRPCPVCDEEHAAEERYAWTLAQLIVRGFMPVDKAGSRVCLKHCLTTCAQLPASQARDMLAIMEKRLGDLQLRCREFVESFEYRHKGPKPPADVLYETVRTVNLASPIP